MTAGWRPTMLSVLQNAMLHILALTIKSCKCTAISKPRHIGYHLIKLRLGLTDEIGEFEAKKSMRVLKFANYLAEF
jgi:hypothetical protein